jgi:hypothetical protein
MDFIGSIYYKTKIILTTIKTYRTLETSLHIPWNLTGCVILLEEKFPSGAFVDPDELARDRSNAVNCVLQHIDVEAFELKSQPFRVLSYSPPIITGQTG